MNNYESFEAWALANQPWLVEETESDFDRLLQVTARQAFSAGESKVTAGSAQTAKREDNKALRALFTLPPIKRTDSTALAVPEMPKETVTTGDREVDAVLWLESLVRTGHKAYIEKALEAVKRIKTPMKELESRYTEHFRRAGAHPLQIAFASMGFGDLESKAKAAIENVKAAHEALARFGSVEALFADTKAEKACKKVLRGLKRDDFGFYKDAHANERFSYHLPLVPFSIYDCLYARKYHRDLYRLRNAFDGCGDGLPQAFAHECFCLAMTGQIKPRNAVEAMAAFDHLYESDSDDSKEAPAILRNLIVSGWIAHSESDRHEELA